MQEPRETTLTASACFRERLCYCFSNFLSKSFLWLAILCPNVFSLILGNDNLHIRLLLISACLLYVGISNAYFSLISLLIHACGGAYFSHCDSRSKQFVNSIQVLFLPSVRIDFPKSFNLKTSFRSGIWARNAFRPN